MRKNSPKELDDALDAVAQALREAQSVLFVTGAGISAESGIPTYRGVGGIYTNADTPDGMPIEVALSGETFRRSPMITWRYIHQIAAASQDAHENRAHEIVAAFEEKFDRVWVLTQNVDGFHRKAGSSNVIDIHGDVHELLCTSCSYRETVDDYRGLGEVPRCPACSGFLRPDVVLFGELLPVEKVETLHRETAKGFDAVFSIGTSGLFPYVIQPVIDGARNGKLTVEVNPDRTTISELVSYRLETGAVTAMEGLWSRL